LRHTAWADGPLKLYNLTKMRGPATFSPLPGYSGQRELNADGIASRACSEAGWMTIIAPPANKSLPELVSDA